MSDKTILVLHEKPWMAAFSTACSVAGVIAVIGVGWLLDSSAMQWAGFALLAITFGARASGVSKQNRKTPQEAADFLAKKFNVRAR